MFLIIREGSSVNFMIVNALKSPITAWIGSNKAFHLYIETLWDFWFQVHNSSLADFLENILSKYRRVISLDSTPFWTRKPAKAKPHHPLNLIILKVQNKILLEKRPESGIWGGLSSLPELENNSPIDGWIKKRLETAPKKISEMNFYKNWV